MADRAKARRLRRWVVEYRRMRRRWRWYKVDHVQVDKVIPYRGRLKLVVCAVCDYGCLQHPSQQEFEALRRLMGFSA